ncbi:MAG: hypothetical protein CVU48_00365 [Candidatus Cloacimonetes bacterium HGW-Cloacimonetes-1]|jgi:hypothetical protein|nr:MAG: hypothetical protein CVU48_00365 [Candidatus Cloacimonetes bacterium HGW-Cloacimonetes-1]
MKNKLFLFVLFPLFMISFYGCASFSRTYNPDNYKLKTQTLADLHLQVEVDTLSLLNSLSVCAYQHGTARINPGIDTTYVSGFTLRDNKIEFYKEALAWSSTTVFYNQGSTTYHTNDYLIPGEDMSLGNPREKRSSLLAIVADPEVPKNIVFQGKPSSFYPEADKRNPISVEKFTQYRIRNVDSWFYYKRGTSSADVDSMNLSLFLSPIAYADVKAKSKIFKKKKEGSAVLLYTYPIHEIYDPALTIVKKQVQENQVLSNSNPKGKVVITFTGTTQYRPSIGGALLLAPAVITFCTSPLFGIPYMAYTAEMPIKASVYDSTGKLIKEYHNVGKKTGYSAYYWGYHYNVFKQPTLAPTGGIFGQPVFRDAHSKALINAIDNVLQDIVNDRQAIENGLQ